MIKHVFIFGIILPTAVTVVLFVAFLVCWFKFNLQGRFFKKQLHVEKLPTANGGITTTTTTQSGLVVETTEITSTTMPQCGGLSPHGCGAMCHKSGNGILPCQNGGGVLNEVVHYCTEGNVDDDDDDKDMCHSHHQFDDASVNVCQKMSLCSHEYKQHVAQNGSVSTDGNGCQHQNDSNMYHQCQMQHHHQRCGSNGRCYTNPNLCLSPTDPEHKSITMNGGVAGKHTAATMPHHHHHHHMLPRSANSGGSNIVAATTETFVQQTFHFPVDSDAGSEDGSVAAYTQFTPTATTNDSALTAADATAKHKTATCNNKRVNHRNRSYCAVNDSEGAEDDSNSDVLTAASSMIDTTRCQMTDITI